MSAVDFLAQEKIWFDKPRYDEAERRFYEHVNGSPQTTKVPTLSYKLNLELQAFMVDNLRAALSKLECRVAVLEKSPAAVSPAPAPSVPYTNEEEEEEDDDDIDLFGSDEDEEAEKLKEQRLKEYAEKKAKKPAIIAKSSILLDVKPWDDETDMAKLEECVRSVQADGLLWGTSKLVPVGYGIKKLQIACVVEDDKVGTDMLEEEITKFEDYVSAVQYTNFCKGLIDRLGLQNSSQQEMLIEFMCFIFI
uniref:Eukaryotic translation elongation factor 1 delta b (guanine nucleotide exchange protein) n=1 Tax=Amphilophus citrinellus TaxID=61819 RepID=A0A3Q0RWC4_AMPCI